jgi:signal transduction histidine kinase
MTEPDSHIIIGPDGTVLAATGRVSPAIVDARLEECSDLAPEIREAGAALVKQLRSLGTRAAIHNVVLDGGARAVQLVAIEALVIRRTPTDLRALLTSKLAVILSQATEVDVTLSVVVAGDVPQVVLLDSERVAWAVTTLVGNALRYMRSGSRRMDGRAIDVRVSFDSSRSQLAIEVHDDGMGIPADTVTRLFRRDSLNVRGAGLALLLMHDICAAHGGTVDVRSSTGGADHGTTVRLTFPTR